MTPVRKQGVQVVAGKYFAVNVQDGSDGFNVVVRAADRASASVEVSQVVKQIGKNVRVVGSVAELNVLPVDAKQVDGNKNAWIDNSPVDVKFTFGGGVVLEAPKDDEFVDDSDWASKPLNFDDEE